jgi:hypothetical protein
MPATAEMLETSRTSNKRRIASNNSGVATEGRPATTEMLRTSRAATAAGTLATTEVLQQKGGQQHQNTRYITRTSNISRDSGNTKGLSNRR